MIMNRYVSSDMWVDYKSVKEQCVIPMYVSGHYCFGVTINKARISLSHQVYVAKIIFSITFAGFLSKNLFYINNLLYISLKKLWENG